MPYFGRAEQFFLPDQVKAMREAFKIVWGSQHGSLCPDAEELADSIMLVAVDGVTDPVVLANRVLQARMNQLSE